jgi:hypothetical protein
MYERCPLGLRRHESHAGFSLLETMIATGLLLTVSTGLLCMAVLATSTTESQGHLAARTTEYAQDKMEQLLALAYGDSTSDTTVFPAANSGGTGLTIGGSSNPSAPVSQYIDFLDADGNLLVAVGTTPPAGWFYKRVWQISSPSANLKQITVTAIVASSSSPAQIPQSTVTALKTNPF